MQRLTRWHRETLAASIQVIRARGRTKPLLFLVLALFGQPAKVAGQGLTRPVAESADTLVLSLAEAQEFALTLSPALMAERRESAIASGELRQARALAPNPELEIQPDVEFGAGSASTVRGRVGKYEAALTQEIEWAGQRGLRVRAGEHGLDRARSGVSDAERTTVAEVAGAFYQAYAAARQLELARDILQSNERLLDAVRVQLREGGVSGLEVDLTEVEAGRSRGRMLAALREARSAEIELKRLIGIAPERPVRLFDDLVPAPDPASLSRESLAQTALGRRPDLAARVAGVREAETLRALAAREAIPSLRLSVISARSADGGRPWIGLGVALPLPLWNRNQGEVAARDAAADQAALLRRATELTIHAQVEEAYGAYVAAAEEERVYGETVLQPARASQQRLDSAFRAGKLNLSAVLLLRNQLLEAESGYWDAWLAKREALARLESATAGSISND